VSGAHDRPESSTGSRYSDGLFQDRFRAYCLPIGFQRHWPWKPESTALRFSGVASAGAPWCAARLSKKGPASGAGLQGGRSETLEGSCLTFTPNITALHSVPLAKRGRAVRQNESPAQQEKGRGSGEPSYGNLQEGGFSAKYLRPIGLHGPDSSHSAPRKPLCAMLSRIASAAVQAAMGSAPTATPRL